MIKCIVNSTSEVSSVLFQTCTVICKQNLLEQICMVPVIERVECNKLQWAKESRQSASHQNHTRNMTVKNFSCLFYIILLYYSFILFSKNINIKLLVNHFQLSDCCVENVQQRGFKKSPFTFYSSKLNNRKDGF